MMRLVVRGALWIGLFVACGLAPLVFAAVGVPGPSRGFATEFSAALGFVGLALMGLEFVLVARFRVVAEPFGTDALVQFHRQIGLVGLVFVVVHVAISAPWRLVVRPFAADTPDRVRWALLATLALLVLVALSLWRKRFHLSYEVWHLLHAVLAVLVVVAALMHALLVDFYLATAWKRALWIVLAAVFVALLVWVRIGRPLAMRGRPWTVTAVTPERGRTTTLTLRPDRPPGLSFAPGQYAWFAIGRSPFSLTKHPFSLSSSAESPDTVTVSIKALGDFTASVSRLEVGTKVYLDGPHGVFSPDLYEGPGFCLIAGGVGVTPVLSILRTFVDRGDQRPIVACIANRRQDEIAFRDELQLLVGRLNLTLVHALDNPAPGWTGETGRVDANLLRRVLPPGYRRWQFFVCGPDPMMDAMEEVLTAIGVPAERVHTERFSWV